MVKIGELVGLVEFLETAKTESLSRAATNLKVSVAHVSRSITAIEERLSLSLFTRTTRHVRLTDEGRAFYSQCLPLLEELSLIQKQVRDVPLELEGTIRLSVAGRFAQQTITPIVARFCLLHPKVFCEVNFTTRKIDLLSENFDIAIRTGDLGNSTSLIAKKITVLPLLTVAGPTLAKKLEGIKSPNELDRSLCLSHWNREWKFRRKEKTIVFQPGGRLECNNAEALVNATIAGLGIAQIPAHSGVEALAAGRVIEILPEWQESMGVTYNIVYPKQAFQPRRVQAMIEHLSNEVPTFDH